MADASDRVYKMAQRKYEDDVLARHVLEDAHDKATLDKIVSGELALPDRIDAQRDYDKARGVFAATEGERKALDRVKQLEDRLSALEGAGKTNPSPARKDDAGAPPWSKGKDGPH